MQFTRLELGVSAVSRHDDGNARVNEGGVAGKGKFCGRISNDGVLELLEGRCRDLSHRHIPTLHGVHDQPQRRCITVGLWIHTWPSYQ